MSLSYPPHEDFLRDLLAYRADYALNVNPQRYRAPARPADVTAARPVPVIMELRQPDSLQFAKIAACDVGELRLWVDHVEYFEAGDTVYCTHPDSDDILLRAVIDAVEDQSVWLSEVATVELFRLRIGDHLIRQADHPSTVMTFPEIAPELVDGDEADKVRERKANEPCKVPDERLVRTPGKPSRGIGAWYIPLNAPPARVLITGNLPFEPAESRHGWMLDSVISEDVTFNGRWKHWQDTDRAGEVIAPIPYLPFNEPHAGTMGMLRYCLDLINPNWRTDHHQRVITVEWFLDWLLWSLGHPAIPLFPENRPGIHARAHDSLIQVFDPSRIILFPSDYFGALIATIDDVCLPTVKTANNAIKDIFPGRRNDYREQLLIDPVCLSGRFMLAASNRTYCYQGIEPDGLLAKAALINMYFFCPWFLFPFPWMAERQPTNPDWMSRTLTLLRYKRLPETYFGTIEVDPDQRSLCPILKVQQRDPQMLPDILGSIAPDPQELLRTFGAAESKPFGLPAPKSGVALPMPKAKLPTPKGNKATLPGTQPILPDPLPPSPPRLLNAGDDPDAT